MCKKHFRGFFLFFLMLIGMSSACTERVFAEDALTDVSAAVCASAAILYEPQTGRVLFETHAHERRAMASTTKLMTALVAVDILPLDEEITVSPQAVDVEGTAMGLFANDRITPRDLLYGLLLESGNDAANAIALSCCDSYAAFAQKMNEKAEALGMTDSLFVTPSGLDEGEHGASAYDMALLAAAVLENDLLSEICATEQATISFGEPEREVTLSNHNRLLSLYSDAIGLKTGYTSKAGRCLVSAARRDGITLIAVTLNCSDDWNTHIALFDAGFSTLTPIPLVCPQLPLLPVLGGESTEISLSAAALAPVAGLAGDDSALCATVCLPRFVWAGIQKGETVGKVTYTLRGSVVGEAPIVAEQTVFERPRDRFGKRMLRMFFALFQCAMT